MTSYIFDLDGTLADPSGRQHFLPHDWNGFFDACGGDAPTALVAEALSLAAGGAHLVFLTGRNERARAQTLAWLERQGFAAPELHMRPDDDRRPAVIFKTEAVGRMIEEGRSFIAAYDDEPEILAAFAQNFGIEGRLAPRKTAEVASRAAAPDRRPGQIHLQRLLRR